MVNPPTPTFLFSGEDVDKLHKDITKTIVEHGNDITFGYENKHARDTCMTVHIWGNAVKRLMNGSVPKKFMFNGDKLKEFRKQGIAENTNPYGHVYTYQQLLQEFPRDNGVSYTSQLTGLKKDLRKCISNGVLDNGLIGILYSPLMRHWDEKPCFNWMQVRYLGDNKVSLRLLFRSHDYGMAMWANLSFILYMMRHFVTRPCDCEIVEVILFSSSAHIYEGDQDIAVKIAGVPWKQQEQVVKYKPLYRLMSYYERLIRRN